jgi:glycosyltransferase involved in cell wall biosynthesis
MNKISEISIFFPFWNEEDNIQEVVRNAIPIANNIAEKWEMILVDDGSSDKTLEKAKELEKTHPNIKIISHTPNRGYGAALKTGFENSKYKYIAFTDGDGQFDFSEIDRFISEILKGNADMVIGYRKKRKDNFIRHILMNLLKIWDYIFFRFWFKDIDCGFKMFRKEAIDAIMPLRSEGAMITTEILAKSKKKKLKIKEVEVTHYPRKFGDQSGANLPVIFRAVLESLLIWLEIKNKRI